ncbi:MAG: glycoside hydrolase family 97 C-terminal domain-containing protein [Paludibacteraceae bacterium]
MASDLPENYIDNPAFEFIERVPVDWAKTIILDGKIGDYVVTARKDKYSDDWFVGAVTDENSRLLKMKFDFLGKGRKYEMKLFEDAPDADWKTNPSAIKIVQSEIDSNTVINLSLVKGGEESLFI